MLGKEEGKRRERRKGITGKEEDRRRRRRRRDWKEVGWRGEREGEV